MRKFVFTILSLGIASISFCQKVDLDKFYFDVKYQKLPKEPVFFEDRTYKVSCKTVGGISSNISASDLEEKIIIHGWKKVDSNPTVTIEVVVEDFVAGESKIGSRVEESKDRSGKVTRVTYYSIASKFTSRGHAFIKGPMTMAPPSEKELEEKKKQEEEIANNRFLKNAVIAKSAEPTEPKQIRLNLSEALEYNTLESTDYKKVVQDLSNNKSATYDINLRDYIKKTTAYLNSRINTIYGFTPVKDKELLWIMDAKNDEGAAQTEAISAVKTIFAEMRADQPIDGIVDNLQPLIDYFDSLKTKYNSSDKAHRKIRYSSYFNLAQIYLSIDQPEKAIKEAEGLITNDYDAKDGKNFIESAELLITEFKNTKTRTRHTITLN